jgi:hypothetical protein
VKAVPAVPWAVGCSPGKVAQAEREDVRIADATTSTNGFKVASCRFHVQL